MRDLRQLFQQRIQFIDHALTLSTSSNSDGILIAIYMMILIIHYTVETEVWLAQTGEFLEQLAMELNDFSEYLVSERTHLYEYSNGV